MSTASTTSPATSHGASRDSSSLSETEKTLLAVVTSRDGVSRSELSASTGMATSTVSSLVRKLADRGLVVEREGGESTGGRPPRLIHPTRISGHIHCAELGTTHARVGVITLSDNKIAVSRDVPITLSDGPTAIVEQLAREWADMDAELADQGPLRCVGLAVPGPVQDGCVRGAARMPGWNGHDIASQLVQTFDVPAIVENDGRAGAIGEWHLRHPDADPVESTGESYIYVKAGRGVGGGWVRDGHVDRGAHGFAGDITHVRVDVANPQVCSCGNHGCLETVASGAALLRRIQTIADRYHSFETSSDLVSAVVNGDPQVTALVREAGSRLGEVLAGLVNFLNPHRVIIGGSLSQIGAFIAGARSEIYDRCLPISTARLSIEASRAGADAALLGLAALAHDLIDTGVAS